MLLSSNNLVVDFATFLCHRLSLSDDDEGIAVVEFLNVFILVLDYGKSLNIKTRIPNK